MIKTIVTLFAGLSFCVAGGLAASERVRSGDWFLRACGHKQTTPARRAA